LRICPYVALLFLPLVSLLSVCGVLALVVDNHP
jgi:hypothetical protein